MFQKSNICQKLLSTWKVCFNFILLKKYSRIAYYALLREVFIGGGGWAGASEGRALSKFVTNWGGSNLFYSQLGEGHNFFGKEKIAQCRFYFVYTCKATSQD